MNFFRYTFTGRFFLYTSVALLITTLMVVLLALMKITTGVIICFSVFILFVLVAIIKRYFAWIRYREFQKFNEKSLHAYADRKN